VNKNFELGPWMVNCNEGTVCSSDEVKRLEPKVLSVLYLLAEAEGAVVSRDNFLDSVWPDQVVGDDVINSSIAALRKALGDDRKTNSYIKTVPKKGYQLVKQIKWIDDNSNDSQGEITKHQTKKTLTRKMHWLSIVFLTIVLYSIVIYFSLPPAKEDLTEEKDYSIAVLPFDVYSDLDELSFFSDGLAEEILHQLATNNQLNVMSRSASFQFRNSDKELSVIADELNVKYLIEGSIREYNNELRITIQLLDATTNYQLWSRVFDDKSGDLFRIQQKVATAINNMLNLGDSSATTTVKPRSHPDSDEAYKYYLMAQAHFKNAGINSYNNAIALLDKAIKIAPDYALAYTSKAVGYLLSFQYNNISLNRAVEIASDSIDKALEINPLQPEAFAARGLMYTYTQKFGKAETAFLRAVELNPQLRIARHNYGFMLWKEARYRESLQQLDVAIEIDPLAKPTNFLIGDSLARLAEFQKAITHYQHCQSVLPEYVWCYSGLADIYRILGRLDFAKTNMDKSYQVENTGDTWRDISHISLMIYLEQYQQALALHKKIEHKMVTGNNLFRNIWLLSRAEKSDAKFYSYIEGKYEKHSKNLSTKKYRALAAFMQQEYDLAVELYESVLEDNPNTIYEILDYADGLSHAINLAVSYEKIGKSQQRELILMQLEQHLNSFSERLDQVSGVLYIKAKYQIMIGNKAASEQLLKKVKKQWPLKWQIEQDPFWTL